MSPWLFSVHMDAVMKEVKMGRRGESRYYLASCMQMTWFCVVSQMMVGQFVEVCKRDLKANASKSKVMELNGEKRMEGEVYIDRIL